MPHEPPYRSSCSALAPRINNKHALIQKNDDSNIDGVYEVFVDALERLQRAVSVLQEKSHGRY
jgi:hypothetical protein